MIDNYVAQLRRALNYRKQLELPGMILVITGVIAGLIAFIFLATVMVPSGHPPEHHFADEQGGITLLSAILIALASAFSLASCIIHFRTGGSHTWLWALMAAGFAFLSFDELMGVHELVGGLFGRLFDSGMFRNWNDVIVILYGVAALPLVARFLPALLKYRMVIELFSIAFLFYSIHTVIDSLYEPPTTTSIILEESAKVFCMAFLGMGAFTGFLGNVWNNLQTGRVEDEQTRMQLQ